jgi:hypothetical protein
LNETNANTDNKKKILRRDLFMKGEYEYQKKKVFIRKCLLEINLQKFSYYPLFNKIDIISKETILKEIDTKNNVIILGERKINKNKSLNNENIFDNKFNNSNFIYLHNNKYDNDDKNIDLISNEFCINFDNPILDIKFDSSILQKMSYSIVKDLGKVYELKDYFLKIKTKRNKPNMDEISLISHEEIKFDNENTKINIFLSDKKNNDDDLDYIYNKVQLKLLDIKKDIIKQLNEDIIIYGDFISNKNKEFKLYLKNDEIVLEGSFNSTYMKIRKFIKNYIKSDI